MMQSEIIATITGDAEYLCKYADILVKLDELESWLTNRGLDLKIEIKPTRYEFSRDEEKELES